MPPLEILVHVSAPSRGRDDARYRAEARGFLEFEPVERHGIFRSTDRTQDSNGHMILCTPELYPPRPSPRTNDLGNDEPFQIEGLRRRGTNGANKGTTTDELSRESLYEKNSIIAGKNAKGSFSNIRDVWGDHGKILRGPQESLSGLKIDAGQQLFEAQDGFRKKLSAHLTPSRVPTAVFGSVHENTEGNLQGRSLKTPSVARPVHASALQLTSVKETPHLLVERTPALPRPRTAPTAATPSQEAQPLRRTQSDSWQTPPSTIPDSQPSYRLPEVTSSPYLKRPFQSSSPSPTRPSLPEKKKPRLQSSSSSSSSPPTELPAPESPPAPTLPPSSTPVASPASSPQHPTPVPPSRHARSSNKNPLEIHPPPPEPGKAKFTTHLTPSLTTVAAQLTKFFPKYNKAQTRPLQILERGHWLVPFSGQNPTFQKDLWEFLISFVGEGQAGWGTWAVRDEVKVENVEKGKDDEGSEENGQTSNRKEEVLRVYCWGEVVAEVWLIMFVGGKRGIKGLGSKWIDAGGEAVVLME